MKAKVLIAKGWQTLLLLAAMAGLLVWNIRLGALVREPSRNGPRRSRLAQFCPHSSQRH